MNIIDLMIDILSRGRDSSCQNSFIYLCWWEIVMKNEGLLIGCLWLCFPEVVLLLLSWVMSPFAKWLPNLRTRFSIWERKTFNASLSRLYIVGDMDHLVIFQRFTHFFDKIVFASITVWEKRDDLQIFHFFNEFVFLPITEMRDHLKTFHFFTVLMKSTSHHKDGNHG